MWRNLVKGMLLGMLVLAPLGCEPQPVVEPDDEDTTVVEERDTVVNEEPDTGAGTGVDVNVGGERGVDVGVNEGAADENP